MFINLLLTLLASLLLIDPLAAAASTSPSKTKAPSKTSSSSKASSTSKTTSSDSKTASPFLPSTTSLLLPSYSASLQLYAKVSTYNSTSTVYKVTCLTNSIYSPYAVVTNGPKTWGYYQDDNGAVYDSSCGLSGTTYASCNYYVTGSVEDPVFAKTTLIGDSAFANQLSMAQVSIVTQWPTATPSSTGAAASVNSARATAGAVAAAGLLLGGMFA